MHLYLVINNKWMLRLWSVNSYDHPRNYLNNLFREWEDWEVTECSVNYGPLYKYVGW